MQKEKRRIGYFSKRENGTIDTAILNKDFNDEYCRELDQYTEVIFKLKSILLSYEAIELNYREISYLIEEYDRHFSTVKVIDAIKDNFLLDFFAKANQKITNLLSSATSFLSCSEVRLKEEFNEESEEFHEWNKHRRDLHKQSFEYRFLYELRNYSQHYNLPVDSIEVKLNNITTGERSTLNLIAINRDILLSSGYNWKALKKDIERLDEKIDIMPVVDEYMSSLRKITYKYISIYRTDIQECHRYIAVLRRVFALPENSTPVIYIGETREGQPVPTLIEIIPTLQFDWINKHYLQLKKYTARA